MPERDGPGRDGPGGDRPGSARSRARSGPGRVLVAVYAVFALSATARSVVQIATKFSLAPVPFLLSALAAAVYVVATVALVRGTLRLALAAVVVELVGVVAVGAASLALRGDGVRVICEVKRSSPSKGALAAIADPAGLAADYEAGGAAVISVLTEERRFGGSLADLEAVRAKVDIPVLRKDFMFDTFQCVEARALGADCILIIMAAVDHGTARDLARASEDLGMDVLVEVHDERELDAALELGVRLVGINNRDLRTFRTDLAVSERLAPRVPADRVVVGESGIFTADDCARLRRIGIVTFLIGESLMRQADVAGATRALLAGTVAAAA